MFKNRRFIIGLGGAVVLNALTWVALYYFIPQTDVWIVLLYNIYTGVSLIGEWYKVFYIPASGLAIIIFNTALSVILYKREAILSTVLALGSFVMQGILAIGAGLIIYSNLG